MPTSCNKMVCWSSWVPVAWQITCQPPLWNRGSDNTCTYTGDGCNTNGNGVIGPALGEAGCRHTKTAGGLSEPPGVGDANYNATQYDLSVHLAMKRSVRAANCSLLPIAAATTYPLHEIVTYGRFFDGFQLHGCRMVFVLTHILVMRCGLGIPEAEPPRSAHNS